MKRIPVPLPPPDEQGAIVRFLEHTERRVGRYVQLKQRLIAFLEEKRQATIDLALTRGLHADVRLKPSGTPELDSIPEHWEIRRAKSLCRAIVDCKNRTPADVVGGAFTVVRTTCIKNGKFSEIGSYQTNEADFRTWTSRGRPQSGDVFFTREAPAGEACLAPDRADLCMGQRMMYFRPDSDLLDPKFLLLNIYGPLGRTYIRLATAGSTVGHLRLGQVFGLPVSWCPLEEQREIVAHVERETEVIDKALAKARSEISLLREYRVRLISDAVLGKIDVRAASAALPLIGHAEELAEFQGPEPEEAVDTPEDEPDAKAELVEFS
jgi:type I restriction enzyme S subunit